MTTASNATNLDQTTDAGFRTWVAEMITNLVTNIGLTQTADTGQINTSTVTKPVAINTAAGYVILRFNDTLQSTAPLFIKMEFGSGSTVTNPNVWVTTGTGSNGSGTLTGVLSARTSLLGGVPGSPSAVTPSHYCYSATMGILIFFNKYNLVSNGALISLILFRSTDPTTGASTGDAYEYISTSAVANNGGAATGGSAQCYSYLTSLFVASIVSAGLHASIPFGILSTLFNGGVQVGIQWIVTPKIQVVAAIAPVTFNDFPVGATVVFALVGTTTHTFLCYGQPWGNTAYAGLGAGFCLGLWE